MANNFLQSKIVAGSTSSTWAQAYSTLNLFIVLSLEKTDDNEEVNIATVGKNTLEKLQREFFALDEKKLVDIKEAVEKTTTNIGENINYSIILTTIKENALYIVTAGEGSVVIKRGKKTGTVANGEKGEVASFSGPVEESDLIIIQTHGFSEKIPTQKLSNLLDGVEVLEISESITPLILEEPKGTEAAIVVEYKNEEEQESKEEEPEIKEPEAIAPTPKEKTPETPFRQEMQLSLKKPSFFGKILSKKKIIILFIILLLIGGLYGGITYEKNKQEKAKNQVLLDSALAPAQKKYDEAIALASLNKGLALDNLDQAKQMLDGEKDKFKPSSTERTKIDDFLKKIDDKINELDSGTSAKNQTTIFKPNSDIKQIANLTLKGDDLIVADQNNGKVLFLSKDGKPGKTIETNIKNITLLSADKEQIFALGDGGVYKITKTAGKSQKIISLSSLSDITSLDIFLGNVYLLNSPDKNVEKYATSNFQKGSYFTKDTSLSASPVSMSIDSSIWVLGDNGKVYKFTKGQEDSFSIQGFSKSISKNSIIYTDTDFGNIYILDKDNRRIIVIKKDGTYQSSIEINSLKNISSFAVDEANKKIYILSDNKISSVDF